MIYYQIEDGKVLGWIFGTDIPGDPTATKQVLDIWAAENPKRSVIKKEKGLRGKPEYLVVENGDIREMTSLEKKAVDDAEKSKKDKLAADTASAKSKLAASAGLSKDEEDAFLKSR